MATLVRVIAALLALLRVGRADVPLSSAELKAAYLLNFGSFVHWPVAEAPSSGRPLVIGLCGAPDVARSLQKMVADAPPGNFAVTVIGVPNAAQLPACHIAYFAAGDELNAPWERLARHATLTVGETERFETSGGIIRFVAERNRIRLRINLEQARRATLRIHAPLLRIAETKGVP